MVDVVENTEAKSAMRRNTKCVRKWLVALALVLWHCTMATAQEHAPGATEVPLALKLRVGQVFEFEFETKHHSRSTGDIYYRAELVQKGTLRFHVDDVAPSGLASVSLRLTKYVVEDHFETVGGTNWDRTFNSENPSDVERARRSSESNALILLMDSDFKLDIEQRGSIVGYEAPAPSKSSELAAQGADEVAELLRKLFAPLPGRAVVMGQVWRYTLAQANIRLGTLKIEYTCRLKSLSPSGDETQALIGVVGRVKESSPDEESQMKWEPKSFNLWQDLEFAQKRGLPTSSTDVEEYEFEVTQSGKRSRLYGSDVTSVKSH